MPRKIITSTLSPESANFHCYHLPKGMLILSLFQHKTQGLEPFEIELKASHIPDPEHRYYLNYHKNPYTNDKIEIEFSKDGYLKKISSTIEDKTAEIVEKIISLGEETAKVVTGLRGEAKVLVYEICFDPFSETDLSRVNRDLEAMNTGFRLSIQTLKNSGDIPDEKSNSETIGNVGEKRDEGIYCRPMETFEVLVSKGEVERRKLLRLPHPTLIHFIEIQSARFVSTSFNLAFDDQGYPLNIQVSKPSQALAVIEIPIKILQAIIGIPAKLFQLRVNINNEKAKAMKSEEEMLALIKELKEKEDRRKEEEGGS